MTLALPRIWITRAVRGVTIGLGVANDGTIHAPSEHFASHDAAVPALWGGVVVGT